MKFKPNWIRKLLDWRLAIGILLFVAFWICFFWLYDSNDLFRFPFVADVWGTAIDLLMLLVTIVTAYFLWKTLDSQKEVQRKQDEMFKLEFRRYRLSHMPVFNFEAIKTEQRVQRHSRGVIAFIVFRLSKNTATDVEVGVSDASQFLALRPITHEILPENSTIEVQIDNTHTDEFGKNQTNYFGIFELKFKDDSDNQYVQLFTYSAIGDGEPVIELRGAEYQGS